jgi:DNA replication protein DnaC
LLCADCAEAHDREQEEKEKLESRLKDAGFYKAHWAALIETLNGGQNKIASEYLASPRGNLFLTGASGCGKTWLSVAIIRRLIVGGFAAKFISLPWMFAMLRDSIAKEGGGFALTRYIEKLLSYDYLLLDDLGANRATDWAVETLYLILDQWEANDKPGLIITSNLALDEVSRLFSDRIASRISRGAQIIHVTEKDRRAAVKRG